MKKGLSIREITEKKKAEAKLKPYIPRDQPETAYPGFVLWSNSFVEDRKFGG